MKHWTDFWQHAQSLNSFSESEQAKGYTGAIAELWRNEAAALKTDQRVLELGCGNGALAALILEESRVHGASPKIIATDVADISPLQSLNEAGLREKVKDVEFKGEVNMEVMDFANASFDLIVSQFGFEYSSTEKTLFEVKRLLKSGGKAVFICHHMGSNITAESNIGSRMLKLCLQKSPLFMQTDLHLRLAQAWLKDHHSLTGWPESQEAMATLKTIAWVERCLLDQCKSPAEHPWVIDVTSRLKQVIGTVKRKDLEQSLEYLAHEYQSLSHQALRIAEQEKAALNEEDLIQMQEIATKLKLECTFNALDSEHGTDAWVVVFRH